MLGSNGTQVNSKMLWKGEQGRIDVENPNPGQRPMLIEPLKMFPPIIMVIIRSGKIGHGKAKQLIPILI